APGSGNVKMTRRSRSSEDENLDDERRVVDVPGDLEASLARDRAARAAFERLSYSHRKEYVQWIEEAKREETRRRRIERTLELLREGRGAG
ncbi:MAG: YdeI/OmpD-associated family protein, partial [Actinomycetota bacterium]|nr:YdeI/OmpD-associated family protein [Actinomycetota bacterium]